MVNIPNHKILKNKINSKRAVISVIGLGYVGLPLCMALLKANFKVFGIDNNLNKIKILQKGESYISTIKNSEIRKNSKKYFYPTTNFKNIENADVIIICVPTPININKKPNMQYVKNVVKQVDKYVKKNQLIILECTSYPGTTEEYFLPIFNMKKLKVGYDIFLGYSPEREDPGNKIYSITKGNLAKVVSGYSVNCKKLTAQVYKSITKKIFLTNDIKTAEFTKLLENIYRSVNIGLVNELFLLCKKMGINIYDALSAAKTKPFGFNGFEPGPGVGGHCIPVDPYYLTYKAKEFGLTTKFIKLAGEINDNRPIQIANKIVSYLRKKKSLNNKKILILGITYKKNSDDLRGSPIITICKLLRSKIKNKILICDPNMNKFADNNLKKFDFIDLKTLKNKQFLNNLALCFIGANHDIFDLKFISKNVGKIFDSRNSFKAQNLTNIQSI